MPGSRVAVMNVWRERLILAVAWVACAAFTVIFVVNIAQIIARPINGGWVWVSDLSRLLFAWTVMLGAAAAYGKNDHIVASFLVERLPRLGQQIVGVLVRTIELLVGFILVVAGSQVVATRMDIPFIQLGVPTGWAFASIPVLGVFMLLFGLTSARDIRSAGANDDEPAPEVRDEAATARPEHT